LDGSEDDKVKIQGLATYKPPAPTNIPHAAAAIVDNIIDGPEPEIDSDADSDSEDEENAFR
jgi:hypothetical protein